MTSWAGRSARSGRSGSVTSSASFFAGYEGRTGAMWRAYRDDLESFVARYGRRTTVLAGAMSTFASFIAWIAPLGHGRIDASVRHEP